MQTIDISPTQNFKPKTWADVARLHGVDPKTIERDRSALNRFEDPITPDLLEEIRRLRRWCALGQGGSAFTRRNYVKRKLNGTIEEKLEELRIV